GIPNLWPYIQTDRIIRYNMFVREYPYDTPQHTHEEMIKILQVTAKAIIKFLEEEKPDFIIFSVIGTIGSMLLYEIAKKKNIKTFIISTARIGTRYSLGQTYGDLEYAKETFKDIESNNHLYQKHIQQAEKFLNEFRNHPVPQTTTDSPEARPTTRYKQLSFLMPHKIFHSLRWLIHLFYEYISDKHRNDHSNIKPWHYLWDRIKRKMRILIGFENLYDQIDPNEDFAFFPLQLEPEVASMLFAPFYTDQLWLAEKIARSLPIHFKLYIKEHPAMFGYRPHCYYKKLKKIPNVKIIKPTTMSFSLIQKAKLVMTLTGSTGWEGLLLKKPVITFGTVFYNDLPMVKNCKTIENLPYLVKKQLENFDYNEKTLINLIAAVYKESADVDLVQLWDIEGGGKMEKKEKELMPLVDFIASKL
ncbi:hypothetical protein ACFL1O_00885, partial [Patescibacteria group bacterium]